ncbi:hypothetical protein POM88_037274 [Heracleum sosnowskyi]|uniref:Uncharacterized protein n=1 Tax=Heracleum sosnowskyi TaxID=360622 RepID=A0AAD8HPT8_9APIA|nr:hypothetical protein POM88_037274 [Heracleum sosnowskyi]
MEMPFRSSLPCLFLSDPGGSSAQVSLLILLCLRGLAIKGPDFRNKSPDELKAIVPYIQVMARSLPLDKHKLVTNLRSMHKEVVAVTGDGTNDAPALHEADIGLATGIARTEVVLWRNIAGQSIYQMVLLFVFNFAGKQILGLNGSDATIILNTFIFNTFVGDTKV